jgi:hypothetical protein
MLQMTFISDAYTKLLVNTLPESNQGRSLKFYTTLSGLSQRWFSAKVENPMKYEACLQ